MAAVPHPWTGETFTPPTPLGIAEIENAIVSRLAESIDDIEVVHFPDAPEAYRLTHRSGAALVSYRGAKYGETRDSGAIVQERTLKFGVNLLIRDLGWGLGANSSGSSRGAYQLLDAVRAALTGYRVPGARKMYAAEENFLGRDRQGGVWMYSIIFALGTISIEQHMDRPPALFIKGIARDTGGDSNVTLGAAPYTFNASDQIALGHRNVIALTLSSLSGMTYSQGADFALDAPNGIVTRTASGAISAGATVNVAYSYADSAVATAGQGAPTGA